MNKISKKIVALVTMAAFVLTLVPMAAFAAVGSTVSVDKSEVTINGATQKAEVTVTADIDASDVGANILVWVEKDGVQYRYADYAAVDGTTLNESSDKDAWTGVAILNNHETTAAGKYQVKVQLPEAGDYTVWVGSNLVTGGATSLDQVTKLASTSVKVNAASSTVKAIKVEDVTYPGVPDGVTPSNAIIATVTGQYEGATATDTALEGKTVSVKAPAGFTAYNEDGDAITEATTNDEGKITFNLIADKNVVAGVYTLKLTCEGVTKNVLVTVPGDEDTVAKTVEAVDTGKDLIKSNSKDLSSVAQVVFKNAAGQAVDVTPTSDTSVRILAKPEKFNGTISVGSDKVTDTDNYGLTVATGTLVAGEYKVRVALNNKDSVDISFTVKDFGTPVALQIEATNSDVEKSSTMAMNENAELSKYEVKAVWVDENGVTDPVSDDVVIGLKAGVDKRVTFDEGKVELPALDKTGTKDDNSDLIGAVVTVTAVDAANGFTVEREFTVVDPVNTDGIALAFDSDNGAIEKSNTVTATVVDENGKTVDLTGTPKVKAYVANKSNENAYVSAVPGTYANGEVELTVYADQATTADIVVNVIGTDNKIYGGTLKYTFGDKDVNADTVVAMTIGSTDMIVNNEIVSGDAAPYVADGRTMVPIRALTETFGAEVDYDNDAQTVTIVDGDTTIVMTIGETTYTVNGEEKTMDVAPVIGSGDRTYVPVRFVAEALGYKVTPLYAADNTTASVVFQK